MRLVAGTIGLLVILGLCAPPASAATVEVQVVDSEFTPDPTINVGDTVRWVWNAFMAHNVRSAPWETTTFLSPYYADDTSTFEHTFTTPGVVDYYCDLHGFPIPSTQSLAGMAGRITVVPEPTGILMLAPAAMLLARRGRRRLSRQ